MNETDTAEAVLDALTARVVAHCYCGRDVYAGSGRSDSRARCVCGRRWYRVGGVTCPWEQWYLMRKDGTRSALRGTREFTRYENGDVAYPS
jgi:hypothetical protein